jgi:hypothetical protein
MCNSDRRHFLRMSVVTLGAVGAAGVMGGMAGAAFAADPEPPKKGKVYVCPPCGCAADGKEFPAPGTCPECGMPLVEKGAPPAQLSVQDRAAQGEWGKARPYKARISTGAAAPATSRAQTTALRRL